ncbi:hypothetical protein ERJ75_000666200 [Trypanosoma vivax]|nr:hypothetical protein ERJ75_000666200 [Trypanosoma vivax]
MLHVVMRALAHDTAVVSLRNAATRSLKIRAWIDNIRISGPRRGVEKRGRAATQSLRQCGAMLGEGNCLAKKRVFIAASFDHETGTMCLSKKAIRKLRETPPLGRRTGAELERLTPRMVYAAGVRCVCVCWGTVSF